jgi:FixJ family two-component response regulator
MVMLLLVDDEEACRVATTLLLRHLGYEVQGAASAEEALAVFDPARHELVVTDNRMPGMSGTELAAELKRRAPSTPIVLYSGWPNTSLGSVDALITKPASIGDFRQTLARLLGERAVPARSAERSSQALPPLESRPRGWDESTKQ